MIVKSCKARAVTSPLSILTIMSLRTFSSADTVERCFLLADCNGLDRWLFFLVCRRSATTISKILDRPVIFQLVFKKRCFLSISSGLTCASLKFKVDKCTSFHLNVMGIISIDMDS